MSRYRNLVPKYINTDVNASTVKNLLSTINSMSQQCKRQAVNDDTIERCRSIILLHRPALRERAASLHITELIMEALSPKQPDSNQITHNFNYKYDYNTNVRPNSAGVIMDPFGMPFTNNAMMTHQPPPSTAPVQNLYINNPLSEPVRQQQQQSYQVDQQPLNRKRQPAPPQTFLSPPALTARQKQDRDEYRRDNEMELDQQEISSISSNDNNQPPPPAPPSTASSVTVQLSDLEFLDMESALNDTIIERSVTSYKKLILVVKRVIQRHVKLAIYGRAMDQIYTFDSSIVDDIQSLVNCLNRDGLLNLSKNSNLCPVLVSFTAGYTRLAKTLRRDEMFTLYQYNTVSLVEQLNIDLAQRMQETIDLNINYAQEIEQVKMRLISIQNEIKLYENDKNTLEKLNNIILFNKINYKYNYEQTINENLTNLLQKYELDLQQKGQFEQERNDMKNENDRCNNELNRMRSIYDNAKFQLEFNELNVLNKELEEKNIVLNEYKRQVDIIRAFLTEQKIVVDNPLNPSQTLIDNYRENINNLRENTKLYNRETNLLKVQIAELTKKNEALTLSNDMLKQTQKNLTHTVNEHVQTIKDLKETITKQNSIVQQTDNEYNNELASLNESVKNLKQDLNNKDVKNSELTKLIDNLKTNINNLQSDLQIVKKESDELEIKNSNFNSILSEKQARIDSLQTQLKNKQKQLTEIESQLVNKESQIDLLEKQLESVELKQAAIQSSVQEPVIESSVPNNNDNYNDDVPMTTFVEESNLQKFEEQLQNDINRVKTSLTNILTDSSDIGFDFIMLNDQIASKKLADYENLKEKYVQQKQVTLDNMNTIVKTAQQELESQIEAVNDQLSSVMDKQDNIDTLLVQYKQDYENLARKKVENAPKFRTYSSDIVEKYSKLLKDNNNF
uniref:Desmoplakin n=1 Tax=Buzura suppressaria nuclear polyhedrosis virus TaxID=74320 RepID=A0A0N7CRT2_NPVBS|nr:Desmoplakin [Buzura suppressaria nucleopolyhedrovirus]